MAEQQQLLSRGAAGVAGNLVVLRHDGGEYSLYAHLAEGSVAVKVGDTRFGELTTPDGPQPPVFVQSGWMVEAK